ncbi:MAG: hypothetical protein KF845_09525 [Cyclobacteriaceae bacterium]|nr:hypothetical protein [Cyclobacteriaceae bacterium]
MRGSMPYRNYTVEKEFLVDRMDNSDPVFAFYPENSRERFVFKGWYGEFNGNKLDSLIGRKVKINYVKTNSLYLDKLLKNFRVARLEADGIVIFDNIIDRREANKYDLQ